MFLIKIFHSIFIASLLSILAAFPANAQRTDCIPVAQIFGTPICRAEITVEEKHRDAIKQEFEQQGLDSEQALKNRNIEKLKDILWTKALKHKFGKDALVPTEKDILLYSKAFNDSLERSYEENKKSAAKIKKLLADKKYDSDNEIKLRNLLASIETSIVFYQKRQSYNKDMPPEYHAMISKAQRGIAEAMLKEWRINQLLYQEYGGRLSFQQSRLVPFDAYRKFIAYIRNEGKLVVTDTMYNAVFKSIEDTIEAPRNIIPESESEIYDNYFLTPEWQFEMKSFK